MTAITHLSYNPATVCGFRFTREQWGEFSNFAPFPLTVAEGRMGTSEHLYQMAKFPKGSEARAAVMNAASPKEAKQIAHARIKQGEGQWTEADWNKNRVWIMRHVLLLKFHQHRAVLEPILQETGDRPIVEISKHDKFWGAEPRNDGTLVGYNQLGRLWESIRDEIRDEMRP